VTPSSVTRPRPGGGIFRDMIPGGEQNCDENTHPNKRHRNEVLAVFL
jgi:hypothetical protein